MKRKLINWSTLLSAVTVLIVTIFYTRQLIAEHAVDRRPPQLIEKQLPQVTVLTVTGEEYTAQVEGYGETRTHYSLTVTAQTKGQVSVLSEKLEPGCRVKKGDVLIKLEDSEYLSAVANAKSELASAKLSLLEEQRSASQAKAEWEASGLSGQPASELVLHRPQLEAARASVTKAEAALENAENELSKTIITAPFDALVVDRLTSPGSYLQTGTEVAQLYSTDTIEIPVALSTRDWNNLPDPQELISASALTSVRLNGVDLDTTWSGRVLRAEQHFDPTSRQRNLILAVDSPMDLTPPLLPGVFIEATIQGNTFDNVWKLPNSALSQQGEIWYVTKEDTLAKFQTEPVFSYDGSIYIKAPAQMSMEPTQVVVHPLNSYLAGMLIQPVEVNQNV